MYRSFFKRAIDLIVSLFLLVFLSPVFLLVFLILWLATGRNPFFTQLRPGKNERIFSVIKFKTMNDRRDADGNLLSDEQRLFRVGKIMRSTSLDELPQLINVLKGDMSLVGPRPLLVEYLPLYNTAQKLRHHVRPGITGWAQVNGRNSISWEERLKLDTWYVSNLSFALDMKIWWLTILKVLKKEGITSGTSVTMDKFKGNQV